MAFSSPNNTAGDEEIARALQNQFRNEATARAGSQTANVGGTDSWSTWGWGFFGGGDGDGDSSTPAAAASTPAPMSTTVSSRLEQKKRTSRDRKSSPSSSLSTPATLASTFSDNTPDRSTPPILPLSDLESSPTVFVENPSSGVPPPRGYRKFSIDSFSSGRRTSSDDVFTENDIAVNRRLDQEFRDSDMAAKLAEAEAVELSSRLTQTEAAELSARLTVTEGANMPTRLAVDVGNSNDAVSGSVGGAASSDGGGRGGQRARSRTSSRRPSELRRKVVFWTIRIGAIVFMLGTAVIVCLVAFGGQASESLDPASWLPGWPDKDPNVGSANNIWNVGEEHAGLTLQVIDNLDEKWHDHFVSAIQAWDSGDPDAVTLYIRESNSNDPTCRAVRNVMKACNDNYGPTEWRGVNQILLQGDYIITSVAKMNDYYLDGTSLAQKQYTMCHELGHGLGLGHTDENFHNRDLENCMDYTERPENNMVPNTMNFVTLEELYGSVSIAKESLDAVPPGGGNNGKVRVRGKKRKDEERRRVAEAEAETERLDDEFEFYADFLSEPVQLSSSSTGNQAPSNHGWRMLHTSEKAEHRERDLGGGYTLRTSVLLA